MELFIVNSTAQELSTSREDWGWLSRKQRPNCVMIQYLLFISTSIIRLFFKFRIVAEYKMRHSVAQLSFIPHQTRIACCNLNLNFYRALSKSLLRKMNSNLDRILTQNIIAVVFGYIWSKLYNDSVLLTPIFLRIHLNVEATLIIFLSYPFICGWFCLPLHFQRNEFIIKF